MIQPCTRLVSLPKLFLFIFFSVYLFDRFKGATPCRDARVKQIYCQDYSTEAMENLYLVRVAQILSTSSVVQFFSLLLFAHSLYIYICICPYIWRRYTWALTTVESTSSGRNIAGVDCYRKRFHSGKIVISTVASRATARVKPNIHFKLLTQTVASPVFIFLFVFSSHNGQLM